MAAGGGLQLLLVRHANAEDRAAFARTGKSDFFRPLTPRGRDRMAAAAAGLRKLVPRIDRLATSPFTRAVETAAIVAAEYGDLESERREEIGEGDGEALLAWLRTLDPGRIVAVVGHEPYMGEWASWFLCGDVGDFFVVGKGAAILLEFPGRVEPGAAILRWHLPPAVLRRLGDGTEVTGPVPAEATARRGPGSGRAEGTDIEIERKYLLRELPPELADRDALEIEQGWLPGERILERLRRVETASGETRLVRTMKAGSGMRRIEVEEEPTPAVFDSLWPLTEGHRIRKRRWRVAAPGGTWEIDRFTDFDLVLAEIELQDERERPAAPPWLAPYVVREVTGEPAYLNVNLARRGAAPDE